MISLYLLQGEESPYNSDAEGAIGDVEEDGDERDEEDGDEEDEKDRISGDDEHEGGDWVDLEQSESGDHEEGTFARGNLFRKELDALGRDCRTSPRLAAQFVTYMRDVARDTRHSWVEVNDEELTR